jgi:phage terminase large subunit
MSATSVNIPEALAPLFSPARYKFVRGGRGSGKSWGIARALLVQAASTPHRILCAREVQTSIKQSVHQLLRDQIEALGLSSFFEILSTEIRGRNGSTFTFRGLSDLTADSIKSLEGYTRVWLEEAQTITARSWKILTPTIRADGSEIWASYNPELESDETHQRAAVRPHPQTVSIVMNWRDNPWFPAELEKERQHAKATMTADEYAHVWEGQCRPAVQGAIYAGEMAQVLMQGRITRVPHDPMLKTHAVWDLGWNDSMSIIMVQRAASELRVIDYLEDSHRAIDEYIRPRDPTQPVGDELALKPYTWGNDWLPHDGYATRHQTGKSDSEVLEALGRVPQMTPSIEVEQGIRTARLVFPRIWFNDTPGVQRLIECLKRYRRNVSKTTGEAGTPRHDEFSHGADAFRYLGLVADQLTNNVVKTPRPTARQIAMGGATAWMG